MDPEAWRPRRGRLNHEWDQCLHALLVIQIRFAELLGEKSFFGAQFEYPTQRSQRETEEAAQFAVHQCSSQQSQQKSGVNRMADNSIRPALDQLVLLLDSDAPAPVASDPQA